MIFKSALVAAAAVALIALLTSKNVMQQRTLTLNGLAYQVTRYSNDVVEVTRQDGLRFTVDMKTGAPTLNVGTKNQLADAVSQLKTVALPELDALDPPA